jgi:hypothetical protein
LDASITSRNRLRSTLAHDSTLRSALSPHIHARAVVQRLGDMRGGDGLGLGQVGDGTGQLQYAMEGARRELQALGGWAVGSASQ